MKKLSMTFSTVFIILLGATTICADDIQDGFFGVKWGTNIANLKDFKSLYSKNKADFYVNPNEILTIKNISTAHVIYGFYSDKLFAVYIKIGSMEAYGEIKRYVKDKYGIPNVSYSMKKKQKIEKWKYKDVKIKLKFNESPLKMKLAFYYVPLSGSVNEEMQEKYHETSLQFLPTIKKKEKPPNLMPLLTF